MANVERPEDLPELIAPRNLPPEFQELNRDVLEQLANGSTTDLGNGPGEVGAPQEPRPVQAQTTAPKVNSLAWMRGIEPPPAEDGMPAELRDTPQSALDSVEPIFEGEHPTKHRQSGVSPGNAEAEDEDPDHPYGG